MNITDKALENLLKLRPSDQAALRISIQGAGCSGLSYKMEWIVDVASNDHIFTSKYQYVHLIYVIDRKSYLFLKDVTLDYSNDLNDGGFKYLNPNAKRTCGCGSSFST